jgi:hypothetical protein
MGLLFLKSSLFIKYGLTFKIYAPFYVILFLIMILFFKIQINKILLLLSLISMLSIFFISFYHVDLSYIFYTANIVIAFMIFSLVDRDLFIRIIKISSLIIFLMLIGAWITFFYVYFTNNFPETKFELIGGREIPEGILSFGAKLENNVNIFRASSIYDEPGTFSFVIVFIAAIRHFLNMEKKNTWIILILGFVTISLAHLIYVTLHFLAEKKKFNTFILYIFPLVLTFIILKNDIMFVYEIFDNLFSRLLINDVDVKIFKDNNRYEYWAHSIAQLQNFHLHNWFFGIDEVETTGCCNPLIYLVLLGLVGSWPNYLIMFYLFFYSILKKNTIVFAIFLVLIQRPAIYAAGGAFLVAAFVFSLNLLKNNETKKNLNK